jgi:hypothetical protein
LNKEPKINSSKDGSDVRANFEKYVKTVDLELFFKKLGATKPETLARNVRNFTVKEARKRDRIVFRLFRRTRHPTHR